SVLLQATNPGEAGAVLAALPAPTIVTTGSASASVVSNPPSAAGTILAGGATRSFTWTYSVAGSGTLSFTASASGSDENSGTPLTPPAAPAGSATVQKPATLTIASVIASPSLAHLGDAIGVSVAVRNDGEASAADVALSGISASATATQAGSPTATAAQTIPGGGSAVFHIPFVAKSEGSFTLSSGATGRDVNAGTSLTASSVTSAPINITAIEVAITSPDNRATLQAGGSLQAVASAWNTAGATITQLSLSATGPATVAAPASISGSRQTVGGTFSVSANANAAAGSIITLVASATDAARAIVSSIPVTMTVGPPGVLALRCRPQPQLTIAPGQSGEARLEAQKSDGTFEDATLS